ncbi:MAG: hypothetical protein SFU57_01595 [Gemmatimonadales bacterium]|nr:hypothetical protein [Gemmatimonadales bacterium]MDZ4258078.1 hypothetical protein [Gemmatimonadales bacterium]MDZ4389543.1 hypothetical protein [Gemmatimonadales bacterium]
MPRAPRTAQILIALLVAGAGAHAGWDLWHVVEHQQQQHAVTAGEALSHDHHHDEPGSAAEVDKDTGVQHVPDHEHLAVLARTAAPRDAAAAAVLFLPTVRLQDAVWGLNVRVGHVAPVTHPPTGPPLWRNSPPRAPPLG